MSKVFYNFTSPISDVGFITWQYSLLANHLVLNGEKKNNVSVLYPQLLNFFITKNLNADSLETYNSNKALCYYNSEEDSLVLSDFMNKTVWSGTTIEEKEAGLPNITGWCTWLAHDSFGTDGAFYKQKDSPANMLSTHAESGGVNLLKLDASRSSAVYGNSSTVQPPAITLIPQIRFAKDEEPPMGSNPTGTIINFIGTTAPVGYLSCDGTEYQINEYYNLATFFYNQFGSYNYFGGDGETTFAVPDLRGEFLRGTGTNSHTNQGNGSNVGVHQDGTKMPIYLVNYLGSIGVGHNGEHCTIIDHDKKSGNDSTVYYHDPENKNGTYGNIGGAYFTSRPTNTSVLYCIKY